MFKKLILSIAVCYGFLDVMCRNIEKTNDLCISTVKSAEELSRSSLYIDGNLSDEDLDKLNARLINDGKIPDQVFDFFNDFLFFLSNANCTKYKNWKKNCPQVK